MNPNAVATTEPTEAFSYNGLTWVPHFSTRGLYVAPGGKCMDTSALIKAKAKSIMLDLWPRRWKREDLK